MGAQKYARKDGKRRGDWVRDRDGEGCKCEIAGDATGETGIFLFSAKLLRNISGGCFSPERWTRQTERRVVFTLATELISVNASRESTVGF